VDVEEQPGKNLKKVCSFGNLGIIFWTSKRSRKEVQRAATV
jgi:hypothetical protein